MTAPLMPRATAVWLVENTTLTFRQIAEFCELHELEIQAVADGDVASNIMGLSPIDNNQLTLDEIARCEADAFASLVANELERNVKVRNLKAKKILSPSQRSDKPSAVSWIIKNYPELSEAQICKLIGTTKPTIDTIRSGTHRDMANIRPKNPVTIGLCSEKDLDKAISTAKTRIEKAAGKAVRVIDHKAEKAAKEQAAKPVKDTKAKAVKETAPKAEKTVKKAAPKKVAAKKAPAKKAATVKKVSAKKAVVNKKAPAKTAAAKK